MDFKNLSITETYTLCILKNREDIFKNNDLIAHLIVSIIIEMSQNKNLEIIAKNKIKLLNNTPQKPYMNLLYSILKEMNHDIIDLTTCIPKLCIDYNKKIMPIIECNKNNLLNKKIIQIQEEKNYLLKKKLQLLLIMYFNPSYFNYKINFQMN